MDVQFVDVGGDPPAGRANLQAPCQPNRRPGPHRLIIEDVSTGRTEDNENEFSYKFELVMENHSDENIYAVCDRPGDGDPA